MTTTTTAQRDVTTSPARPRRFPRRGWGFLRWAVPTLVVAILFTVTAVTWSIDHVTPTDPHFLEPASPAPVGSRVLAARLRRAGVAVHRYGSSRAALAGTRPGRTTVLVTAPDFVDPRGLLALLARADRVVLVAPSARLLQDAALPFRVTDQRWTTATTQPDCPVPEPGPAAVLGTRYTLTTTDNGRLCYGGGLAMLSGTAMPANLTIVGAADVFRNDRVDESSNGPLAMSLLAGGGPVAWLALHHPEPPDTVPAADPSPSRDTAHSPPPSSTYDSPAPGAPTRRAEGGSSGDGGSGSGGGPSNPLWTTFPPWMWAMIAQLLLAVALFALWRARRLGPPVREPLPVVVHATETVAGRGRLYHRARAHGPALDALRAGALRRFAALAAQDGDPPAQGPPGRPDERLVRELAQRSGWSADRVEAVLYGPAPEDDQALRRAVAELDELVRLVQETKEGTTGAGTV